MIGKLSGGGALPPKASISQLIRGFIGGTLGILILCLLAESSGVAWLMAPFGSIWRHLRASICCTYIAVSST